MKMMMMMIMMMEPETLKALLDFASLAFVDAAPKCVHQQQVFFLAVYKRQLKHVVCVCVINRKDSVCPMQLVIPINRKPIKGNNIMKNNFVNRVNKYMEKKMACTLLNVETVILA